MKRVISDILQIPCRIEEITENEKNAFAQYSHLQRYHPGLDKFLDDDTLWRKMSALPTRYIIKEWKDKTNDHWNCGRVDTAMRSRGSSSQDSLTTVQDVSETLEPVKVFVKVIHLLDPIGILRQEYMTPEHPLLPQGKKAWQNTLQKLHSPNNQAYVDTVANYVLSKFRERDLTPHCTLAYGSTTGIASSYKYKISEDFKSYRQCRWFWRGLKSHGARLQILKDNQDVTNDPDFHEFYEELLKSPFDDCDDSSITDLSSDRLPTIENIEDGTESLHSFTFTEPPTLNIIDSSCNSGQVSSSSSTGFLQDLIETNGRNSRRNSSYEGDIEDEDEDDESSSSIESELDVNIEMPSMPVILVYQEFHSGTMDELLEKEEIAGHKKGSKGWEKIWLAWIWQVISVLGFLQKAICFTHNDLHTNNVLWRDTDEEYLYYKSRDGTVWRVPTYGKIFSLIDFGRAIFRLGKQLWISDDHWPEHDAGGQYNFGPILNIFEPKVSPNPSFDLCRLAVSLIDGLFEDIPDKRKGRMAAPISQDGSWIVYETVSPLFNLLYSWTIDDTGKTIYEEEDGGERYPGFDLYVRIARDVHSAVPREQFNKPFFEAFRFKGKIPAEKSVYSLGY